MTLMCPDDVPVLVAGAAPAGLAAALELTRHDIPCLLIERRAQLSSHPRATVLSLRSMEIVRAWGLEADVRARSVDVDWRMLESETLADAAAGTALAVGYPSPQQSRMISPTTPACVAQDDVEPLLLEGFTTLFYAPLWEVVGDRRHPIYSVTHAAAPGAFVPAGPSERWLFGLRGSGDDPPDSRRAAKLIRLGAGVPELPVRVVRSRFFSAAAQLAERWRSGPVFLAGDAAHRVTPRGGTGLNLALHDGYDLGWRLGWVLRGWAAPALLDAYETERRPVAEHTAARSSEPNGSIRPAEREVHADLGGRIAHVWAEERSTLDLLGPGLTLFAARDHTAWDSAAASLSTRLPVTARLLDRLAARALGAPGGAALLARSDGTPVGVFPAGADPLPSLRAAVAAVAASRPPSAQRRPSGRSRAAPHP
jgi:2-polyprenyl-6-methoxyphenol hydroxylase-like FAD-dependent oxidoreductase